MLRIAFVLLTVSVLLCCAVSAQNVINAGGATFPYPIYSKWFAEYNKLHPDIQINYQSIGSGGGIRQVTAGTLDFGASDGPMSDEQLAQSKVKIIYKGQVIKSFLEWMSTDGKKMTESLSYAPLPSNVVQMEQAVFKNLK